MPAAVLLNVCRGYFNPPARIDTPSTSRMLPIIDPVIDAFTSGYIAGPLARIIRPMINSAALPKLAFSSPPTPAPSVWARFSVARPITPAKGMIASPERRNIHSGPK